MKFRAPKYSPQERKYRASKAVNEWHRVFAWKPIAVPQQNFDGIILHRHYVWLEFVARTTRDSDGYPPYVYRTYSHEPSLREIVNR